MRGRNCRPISDPVTVSSILIVLGPKNVYSPLRFSAGEEVYNRLNEESIRGSERVLGL